MTINEKKMNVRSVQLSDYEVKTLTDAKQTLIMLFEKLTAQENVNITYNVLSELDRLLEELNNNNNSILEFTEDK